MFPQPNEIANLVLSPGSTERPLLLSQLHGAEVWCKRNLRVDDPAGSLRNNALKPDLVVLVSENDGWWNTAVPNPRAKVNELCRIRDAMIVQGGDDPRPPTGGRVLLFYPHESLCDGAAWQSSNGYFDHWNIPPWDTWFWYAKTPEGRDVLYSWVPAEFVELASVGVSVNPEECLVWLR